MNGLARQLADLRPNPEEIRFLLLNTAGMDPEVIDFNGDPVLIWERVLDEAWKRQCLDAIVTAIGAEYSAEKEALGSAMQSYREARSSVQSLPPLLTPHLRMDLVGLLIRFDEFSSPVHLQTFISSHQSLAPCTSAIPTQLGPREHFVREFVTYVERLQRSAFLLFTVLEQLDALHPNIVFAPQLRRVSAQLGLAANMDAVDRSVAADDEDAGDTAMLYFKGPLPIESTREESEESKIPPADWIDASQSSPSEFALRIAMLVFHGGSWDRCVAGFRALEEVVSTTSSVPDATQAPAEPATKPPSISAGVASAGARLDQNGSDKTIRIDGVDRQAVLDHVWAAQYHRSALCLWFRSLATSRDREVRYRVAGVIGVLFARNSESIRREVLEPWAHQHEQAAALRVTIAIALRVAVEEPNGATTVENLLRLWGRSNRSLKWAAARALIYVTRAKGLRDAIRSLRAILESEGDVVHIRGIGSRWFVGTDGFRASMIDAVEKLVLHVVATTDAHSGVLVETLEECDQWIGDDRIVNGDAPQGDASKPGRNLPPGNGLLVTVRIARLKLPDSTGTLEQPLLLAVPHVDAEYYDRVGRSLSRLLDNPLTCDAVLQVLSEWVAMCSDRSELAPRLQEALDSILKQVGDPGRTRRLFAQNFEVYSPQVRFAPHLGLREIPVTGRVLVVLDASSSARPFWPEIRNLGGELCARLPSTTERTVFLLSSAVAADISSPNLAAPEGEADGRVGLLAPIMRGIEPLPAVPTTVVIIGSGEIYDLVDWVDHPSVDRWILIRSGPDRLSSDARVQKYCIESERFEDLVEHLSISWPPAPREVPTRRIGGTLGDAWRVDRSGFPLRYMRPLGGFFQFFPVAKSLFERYLVSPDCKDWDDARYEKVLETNPRSSWADAPRAEVSRLLLSGILPDEAEAFAEWAGLGARLLSADEWLRCCDDLEQQPVEDPPPGLSVDAMAMWDCIVDSLNPANLLALSLMDRGTRELVRQSPGMHYGALGSPVDPSRTTNRDPRQCIDMPPSPSRRLGCGIRLAMKPLNS
jgi:hypothetical protein